MCTRVLLCNPVYPCVLLCTVYSHWEWSGTRWSSSVHTVWILSLDQQWHSPEEPMGTARLDPPPPSDWKMSKSQSEHSDQQHSLIQCLIKLMSHVNGKSVSAVSWRFGEQEDFWTRTFGEWKPDNIQAHCDLPGSTDPVIATKNWCDLLWSTEIYSDLQ